MNQTMDLATQQPAPLAAEAYGLSAATIAKLRTAPILSSLDDDGMHYLDGSKLRQLVEDELLVRQGDVTQHFWILLEGSLRLTYQDPNGHEQTGWILEPGASFGEVPLLAGVPAPNNLRATRPSELLELTEDQFWAVMTACPAVRKAVLGNMAIRLNKMQSATFQQEKMAALGTLAAGLMHELNNPGSAARRASATLRENFTRLQRLSSRFSRSPMNDAQKHCLVDMQDHALEHRQPVALSTIEQTDAEEALAEWMEHAGIEDAWKLAPAFISIGMGIEDLDCAKHTFPKDTFSDALSWLEALISNQQLVGIIEESIGRVTDLVHAVKSYAYEGRGQRQEIDLNNSVHATLVILGHKMREKQVTLEKDFSPNLPMLEVDCQGINQVWTNLLDNAIDAVPQGGHIGVKTWSEEVTLSGPKAADADQIRTDLCIAITDNGPGIPLDAQPHIFDPFFTTKPVGVGTGLGLGIVYRIVEQCHGAVRFSSMPGETEFIVRLPARRAD